MQEFIALSEAAATAVAETHDAGADALLGLGVFGLGLGIVFVGLISLIFITWLYPRILKAILPSEETKERKAARKAERLLANKQEKAKAVVAESAVVQASTVAEAFDSEDADPALIAVITAAVAASLGTSTNGIVIKSLRRARPSLPAWGSSARIEQITNRL